MSKVTVWRMRERYAQTVLTFRITYVLRSIRLGSIQSSDSASPSTVKRPSLLQFCSMSQCTCLRPSLYTHLIPKAIHSKGPPIFKRIKKWKISTSLIEFQGSKLVIWNKFHIEGTPQIFRRQLHKIWLQWRPGAQRTCAPPDLQHTKIHTTATVSESLVQHIMPYLRSPPKGAFLATDHCFTPPPRQHSLNVLSFPGGSSRQTLLT